MPEFFMLSCADFLCVTILGMLGCHDYIIDLWRHPQHSNRSLKNVNFMILLYEEGQEYVIHDMSFEKHSEVNDYWLHKQEADCIYGLLN